MNITLLGAGAWGTALAIVLAKRHAVLLWGRDAEAIARADAERENSTHLPGFTLPASLALTSDFPQAVAHAANGLLILATSVSGLRPVLTSLKPHPVPNLVWLCKGFEESSAFLPHQIVIQQRPLLKHMIATGWRLWAHEVSKVRKPKMLAHNLTHCSLLNNQKLTQNLKTSYN